MNKTYDPIVRWEKLCPGEGTINEDFYSMFKSRAEELTLTVLRAASQEDAVTLLVEHIKAIGLRKIATSPLTLVDVKEFQDRAIDAGLEFTADMDVETIAQADIGISEFNLGIAQLGSIFQDASDLHTRLVSMLPPVHLALLKTCAMVESIYDALDIIEKAYNGAIPSYLSFITGPSKTADIERELTIGVHGPQKVVVLCVDDT